MKRRGLLKFTLLLLSTLTIMAAAIIAPSIPGIAEVFKGTSGANLLSKLVVSIPTLFIALTAPLAGRYIDKKGRVTLTDTPKNSNYVRLVKTTISSHTILRLSCSRWVYGYVMSQPGILGCMIMVVLCGMRSLVF